MFRGFPRLVTFSAASAPAHIASNTNGSGPRLLVIFSGVRRQIEKTAHALGGGRSRGEEHGRIEDTEGVYCLHFGTRVAI